MSKHTYTKKGRGREGEEGKRAGRGREGQVKAGTVKDRGRYVE